MRPALLEALPLLLLACGTSDDRTDDNKDAGDATTTDATIDASMKDSAMDVSAETSSSDADASMSEAASDASSDGCGSNATILGSCGFVEAGYCIDYMGNWNMNLALTACPEGGAFAWEASCPTQTRTGSCYIDNSGYSFDERCYPPLATQGCQMVCSVLDGGFCPN